MTRHAITPQPPIPPEHHADIVGSVVHISYGALTFEVRATQHRRVFGRDEWLVTPVNGSGEMWLQNIALVR
jgi:hypothetical protein